MVLLDLAVERARGKTVETIKARATLQREQAADKAALGNQIVENERQAKLEADRQRRTNIQARESRHRMDMAQKRFDSENERYKDAQEAARAKAEREAREAQAEADKAKNVHNVSVVGEDGQRKRISIEVADDKDARDIRERKAGASTSVAICQIPAPIR